MLRTIISRNIILTYLPLFFLLIHKGIKYLCLKDTFIYFFEHDKNILTCYVLIITCFWLLINFYFLHYQIIWKICLLLSTINIVSWVCYILFSHWAWCFIKETKTLKRKQCHIQIYIHMFTYKYLVNIYLTKYDNYFITIWSITIQVFPSFSR